jgi:hypothetical protein
MQFGRPKGRLFSVAAPQLDSIQLNHVWSEHIRHGVAITLSYAKVVHKGDIFAFLLLERTKMI